MSEENKEEKSGLMKGCLIVAALGSVLMILFVGFAVFIFSVILGKSFNVFHEMQRQENYNVNEIIYKNGKEEVEIAVIDVQDVIMSGESTDFIKRALRKALNTETVKGVVINLNTPGGEVTATDEIYYEIQKLQNAGKPVVACMHAVAASGGYYIAAGTKYIVANKSTITGSIGVIMSTVNAKKLLDKVGLESVVIKSGKHKDSLNPAKPLSDEDLAHFQKLIDATYMDFAEVVSKGRNIDIAEFKKKDGPYSNARIMKATEALDLKLIDQIGYFDDALAKVITLANADGATVKLYKRPGGFAGIFDIKATGKEVLKESLPVNFAIKPGRMYYLLMN